MKNLRRKKLLTIDVTVGADVQAGDEEPGLPEGEDVALKASSACSPRDVRGSQHQVLLL